MLSLTNQITFVMMIISYIKEEIPMTNFDTNEERQNSYTLENDLRKTIQRQKKTIFRLAERNRMWKIVCAVLAILLVIESIALWGNSGSNEPSTQTAPSQTQTSSQMPEPPKTYEADDEAIDAIMSQMTLVDKINQMIMATPEALTGFDIDNSVKKIIRVKMKRGIMQ